MLSVRLFPPVAVLASFLLISSPLAAQTAPEDDGQFLVGWSRAEFFDTDFGRGQILGRIYYPASSLGRDALPDSSGGPFPLIALNHGWLGRPGNYHELSKHLASWGFVVASIGTETSFFGNMVAEAADSQALIGWVERQSSNTLSPFSGMTDGGPMGAIGHSMGGGSMAYMMGLEPRFRAIVPMEAYNDGLGFDNAAIFNLRTYTGSILFLAGDQDDTAPPSTNALEMYDHCIRTARKHIVLLEGAGHSGPLDEPNTNEPMSAPEQQRFHRRYVGAFLRAELLGEENLYGDMFGHGAVNQPLAQRGLDVTPAFWANPEAASANTTSVGITGIAGQAAIMMWSPVGANFSTSFGDLGLDPRVATVIARQPFGPSGVMDVELPNLPQWSLQTIYFQGIVSKVLSGAVLTRTVAITFP
jgi:dienelactone hydrolase